MKTIEFGFKYTIKLYFYKLLLRIKLINYIFFINQVNRIKSEYLYKFTHGYFVRKDSTGVIGLNSPLWVCWWQGEKKMPEIVRICYRNIIKNSCNHPVILITENNYREYTEIPDYIIEKVKNGNISITHLSDILRVSLLYEHGGIWIDSTILLQKPIDSIINTDFKFYSYRHKVGKNHSIISNGLWTTFFIASGKNNLLMGLIKESLLKYWFKHNITIDYFFMDIIFYNLYSQYHEIKDQIELLPYKEFNIFELQTKGNEKFIQDTYKEIIGNSDFQKISYKKKYNTQTIDGEKTYYSHIQELI